MPNELLETTGASASVEVHIQPRVCLYSLCTLTCAYMCINAPICFGAVLEVEPENGPVSGDFLNEMLLKKYLCANFTHSCVLSY